MKKANNIAVVGATGMVGQTFLKILEKNYFQESNINLLASSNSKGKEIVLRGENHCRRPC
jgi:aspartate-semialdehyde dehydrogenase